MTAEEMVESPSYGEVKASVDRARSSLAEAAEEIVWQIEHRAWEVLGHPDWNRMRQAEYGEAAFMVPRADRPELVGRMRNAGLTQQEIADTAGVHRDTVIQDLKTESRKSDIEPETAPIVNTRGQARPASYAPREPEQQPSPAVEEFLDSDEELQRARYLHEFMKTLTRSDDFMEFDPERLAHLVDLGHVEVVENHLTRVRNWTERLLAAAGGLRVMTGGRQ